MSENPQKNRILTALCAVASLCFMLFIYAPFELYFSNKGEFFFDAYMMAGPLLVLFFVSTVAGTLFFLVISKAKAYLYLIALCFYVFICSYIQGNYMAGNLPHIKGEMIDWNSNPAQRISSILLWGIMLIVTVLLVKKLKEETLLKTVRYICTGITL
ncbi:MAG: hypothetical protein K5888_10260, partial [Lachnospiraceae bacterium]|nr:hypothetical protein [Lachnospiraceae bacterium]